MLGCRLGCGFFGFRPGGFCAEAAVLVLLFGFWVGSVWFWVVLVCGLMPCLLLGCCVDVGCFWVVRLFGTLLLWVWVLRVVMLVVTWFWYLVGVRSFGRFLGLGSVVVLDFVFVWFGLGGLICALLGYGFGVVAVCRVRPGITGFVSFGLSVCWLDLLKVG